MQVPCSTGPSCGARTGPKELARRNPSISEHCWTPRYHFFWLKMPSKCVPWLVLQVPCSTGPSCGARIGPKELARRNPSIREHYGTPIYTNQHMHQYTQQIDFKWFIVWIILARRLYICNQYLIIGTYWQITLFLLTLPILHFSFAFTHLFMLLLMSCILSILFCFKLAEWTLVSARLFVLFPVTVAVHLMPCLKHSLTIVFGAGNAAFNWSVLVFDVTIQSFQLCI